MYTVTKVVLSSVGYNRALCPWSQNLKTWGAVGLKIQKWGRSPESNSKYEINRRRRGYRYFSGFSRILALTIH